MAGTADDPALLLTCWKDIARYMGKGVRTVQRWEQKLDLPVRRPRGNAYKSSVVARTPDLDVWLASRWSSRTQEEAQVEAAVHHPNADLDHAIQTARALRAANHELTHEITSELKALVQNCRQIQQHTADSKETDQAI
jgi:hypothetical protein